MNTSDHKRARTSTHDGTEGNTVGCGGFVEVNVGGKIYSLLSSLAPQDSLLSTMLSDRWQQSCARDGQGRIFVDRDGELFGDIVRYLRTGSTGCALDTMDETALRRLRLEADYFGLDCLVGEIDALRPVPVLLRSDGWARVTPRRTVHDNGRWELDWCDHSGNESILRPSPTNGDDDYGVSRQNLDRSEMIVGEAGTYILFLRLHTALTHRFQDHHYVQVKVATRDIALGSPYDYTSYGETLVRCGIFDFRAGVDLRNGPRLYATATCAEVVTLLKGDRLWVYHPHGNSPMRNRNLLPQPADVPAELLNSLTLIKMCGNSFTRYERVKGSSLVEANAQWVKKSNDLSPTPYFAPSGPPGISTSITAPCDGHYLILGCTACSWKESAEDDEDEYDVQLQVRDKNKRLLHSIKLFNGENDLTDKKILRRRHPQSMLKLMMLYTCMQDSLRRLLLRELCLLEKLVLTLTCVIRI